MKQKKHRSYRTLVIIVVLVAALSSASLLAGAIFNEEDAVHIKSDDIKSSTLIIGTHLIHLSALTDSVYDIAKNSAVDSGQDNIYYKSELADGTWFEISTASSLLDITTAGTPVEDSVVEALFMTHHTKSDGVTYDLRTNTPVNIFDIENAYDISAMEELKPLKDQWQLMVDNNGEDDASNRIKDILEADYSDDYTADRDDEMSALQRYLDVLVDNDGGAEEQEIVQRVMESVDANRRVHILEKVSEALDEYLEDYESVQPSGGGDDEEDDEDDPAFQQSDSSLISAATESSQNVATSIIEYDGKKLTEGTTVYQFFRYEYETALISDADEDDHADCDVDVSNLISLDNIQNDKIVNRPAELNILNPPILDEATKRFTDKLKAGQSAEYAAAVENKSASVVLDSIVSENTSKINTSRNELEFMITAYCDRIGVDEAISFLDKRIELTQTYYAILPNDAFEEEASVTIDDHIEFLSEKKRAFELANGGNELDKLLSEKSDLNTELRSALDNNDLEGAAEIEDKIAALDDEISGLENASANLVTDLTNKVSDLEDSLADAEAAGNTSLANKLKGDLGAAKADLSDAQSSLSDGTLANEIATLKKDSLSIIGTDNPSDSQLGQLESNVNALNELAAMDAQIAFPAIVDLHKEMAKKATLDNTSDFDDCMASIEDAILNNKDLYDAAMRSDKNAADLEQIGNDFINGDSENDGEILDSSAEGSGVDGPDLSREDLLGKYGPEVFLLALQLYYDETGSDDALNLIATISQNERNLGSLTVFHHYPSTAGEFIPLSAIGAYSEMRYVEKDNGTSATLAQRAKYFEFELYSDAVTKGKTSTEIDYMTQAAVYQNGLHIIEDYSLENFGVDCVYLSGCSFAVVQTEPLSELANELFALFLA